MAGQRVDVISLVVADDQALVRGGFRVMLEQQPDLEVVGEAADGHEAVALVRERGADVVLMDVRMPQLNGIEATRRIGQESPGTRVLILTTYDLDEYVVAALRAGASGFLLKDVPPEVLVRSVRATAANETTLAPPVLQRIVTHYLQTATSGNAALDRLSDREREVLAAMAHGLNNAEIAAALFVSPTTVKTHVANLLAKLGLRDRVQAVILAHESGFMAARRMVRPEG